MGQNVIQIVRKWIRVLAIWMDARHFSYLSVRSSIPLIF
jgi:hypothetical protein